MNLCESCGKSLYPSNGEDRCRLCRKNIRGFAAPDGKLPGRVLYFDEPLAESLAKKRRVA